MHQKKDTSIVYSTKNLCTVKTRLSTILDRETIEGWGFYALHDKLALYHTLYRVDVSVASFVDHVVGVSRKYRGGSNPRSKN